MIVIIIPICMYFQSVQAKSNISPYLLYYNENVRFKKFVCVLL